MCCTREIAMRADVRSFQHKISYVVHRFISLIWSFHKYTYSKTSYCASKVDHNKQMLKKKASKVPFKVEEYKNVKDLQMTSHMDL